MIGRAVACGALLLALVRLAGDAAAQVPRAVPPSIQRGIVIQPESVTVGDPFRVVVRIRAPKGATIDFPNAVDSGGKVESLDPVSVTPGLDSSVTEQTATYRVAAWDVGALPVRLADAVVHDGDAVRRVALDAPDVFVKSVLPADSSERLPKPPRALFEFGPPWWLWLLVALAAALVVALLWWWLRRKRARPALVPEPYELATRDFARVEALGLLAAGEYGQHVALMIEVLRDFLARAVPAARTSLTTIELAQALRGEPHVPTPRLTMLLHDADLIKFAGIRIDAVEGERLGAEARAIVDTVHAAQEAAAAAAVAARLGKREAA